MQSHPFHSVKGRVLFLHWFHIMRKFWVALLFLCKNFSFVTNPAVFFMFLYLSACLCETAWCHFLAISLKKTDTVPTESISSNAGLSQGTHRLYLCWTISKEIKQWSGAGGSNKRSWCECESVKIASVTFGSLACFSYLFVLWSNISSCVKN